MKNGVLSEVLREILSGEPIAPVLNEPTYVAIDRRLHKIIDTVNRCIQKNGIDNVLIDDGYS